MTLIDQIESQGITISLFDGRIKLMPIEKVTPEIIANVRSNRAQILNTLYCRKIQAIQPTVCHCCGHQIFWRRMGNDRYHRWICARCHPPVLEKDLVEYLQQELSLGCNPIAIRFLGYLP